MNNLMITAEIPLNGGETRTYTGRFLGLILDDQFNALVQEKDVMRKIETRPSLPLCPVFMKNDNLSGHRFVMTVKKINGNSVAGKQLFVSERLDHAWKVDPGDHRVRLTTVNKKDIYIVEKEGK